MFRPAVATIKRLFAVSGNRCAFPGCTLPLIDLANGTVTGEVCHIKAQSPDGLRYDSEQDEETRHGFDNLLLLCPAHHKIVDADPDTYTVEELCRIKAQHEVRLTSTAEIDEHLAQQFLRRLEMHGDGNIVGDYSQSRVVKTQIDSSVSRGVVATAGRDVYISIGRPQALRHPERVATHPMVAVQQMRIYHMIDPNDLLEEARTCFHMGDFRGAIALNRVVLQAYKNSSLEEERALAVKAAIYAAIDHRILGEMEQSLRFLLEADNTQGGKDAFVTAEILRVRGSILFESGRIEGSANIVAEASRMTSETEFDELRLMISSWRNVWIARMHPNLSDLYGNRSLHHMLSEIEELYRSVHEGERSVIDRNFAKTIWIKTAGGILVSEGKLREARDLVEPVINEWEQEQSIGSTSWYQPTMIADLYRILADIHCSSKEYEKAASLRKECKKLLKGGRWSCFPFLLSEKS